MLAWINLKFFSTDLKLARYLARPLKTGGILYLCILVFLFFSVQVRYDTKSSEWEKDITYQKFPNCNPRKLYKYSNCCQGVDKNCCINFE